MAVKITGVKPTELPKHDPVAAHLAMQTFLWIDEEDMQAGESTRDNMYDWIVNKKGRAYILNSNNERIYVFGAVAPSGQRYVRTAENGKWSDLLIDLERLAKPPTAT